MKYKLTFKPVVSVIICFYNEEKFLSEAIESVINQSYEKWELILVDDGSTDNSTSIALNFANRQSDTITYLEHANHQNKGLSASRNHGITKAKSKFAAFLDADDVWFPEKLANQIKITEKYPEADIVCGASVYWNSWADESKVDQLVKIGCTQNKLHQPPTLLTSLYPLARGTAPSMSGILAKMEIINKVRGFKESFKDMYEDQVFLSKVYLCASIYVSDECYDKYRQRPESICATVNRSGSYHTFRLRYLNWLKAYMIKNEIHVNEVKKVLNKNLLRYDWPKYDKALRLKKRFKTKVRTSLKSILTKV